MKRLVKPLALARLVILVFLAPLLFSCVDEEELPNTPEGNFEALWKILDEHYCFFDYKQQEYGLDWNAVYNIYKVRAKTFSAFFVIFKYCNFVIRIIISIFAHNKRKRE